MSTIFLDESGYTGQDLLNPEQPIFTLASLNLSESDCKELKDRFFSKVQSTELKYSSLSRKPRQQQMILDFLKELSTKPELIKVLVAHKQFVLLTKMVEMLFEPVCYEEGIDLYDRGGNLALNNLLFYTLPALGGEDFFQKLLKDFQDMIRSKMASYEAFFKPLLTQRYSQDIDELLDFFRVSHYRFGDELLKDELLKTEAPLDITVSSILLLMNSWQKDINENIILIHDKNSAMAKAREMWDALVDPSLPSVEVGYDRRKTIFPIRVAQTYPEDSKSWAGLQLVDILAGAFTHSARWLNKDNNADDDFGESLTKIINESFSVNQIIPELKFTPEQLGTTGGNAVDPNDYVASILSQKYINLS